MRTILNQILSLAIGISGLHAQPSFHLAITHSEVGQLENIWRAEDASRTDLIFVMKEQGNTVEIQQQPGRVFQLVLEDQNSGLLLLRHVPEGSCKIDLLQLSWLVHSIRILDEHGNQQFLFERRINLTDTQMVR